MNNKRMTTTALFCCTIMIVIAIYDAIAVSIGGIDASVSGWLQHTAMQSPAFSFGFGFLAGHFFGYMKPSKDVLADPTEPAYNYKRDILIACALFALAAILTFFMVR